MDKTLLKTKQQNPSQNTIENVMDLVVIIGIVLVLMETIMVSTGMWWILFGGIFYWKNAQNTLQKGIL